MCLQVKDLFFVGSLCIFIIQSLPQAPQTQLCIASACLPGLSAGHRPWPPAGQADQPEDGFKVGREVWVH